MNPLPHNRINHRPIPHHASGIANFKVICVRIRSSEKYSTADAWAAVSARGAVVVVVGDGAVDRAGEDSADDRGSVAGIGLGVEANPADLGLIEKWNCWAK